MLELNGYTEKKNKRKIIIFTSVCSELVMRSAYHRASLVIVHSEQVWLFAILFPTRQHNLVEFLTRDYEAC